MKFSLVIILSLLFSSSFGQKTSISLKAIKSLQDAENFIELNQLLDASIINLISTQDTSNIDKTLLRKKTGETIVVENYTYKVLDNTTKNIFRAAYIFIDGSKFTLAQVDSIRNLILEKYNSGIAFEDLAKEYNMDGNPNNGDTGEFGEKLMMQEFEDAVRTHKKNDVFKVDIPSNQWFYVVKKTYDNKTEKEMTLLKLKSSS